ncbi:hypothetical protein PPL_04034 [Heterostelium album PN500]|uniref:Uncharacterized protein n=1 Tax=Heterostelium pallidum (strain ATCC 26659 / Pp 5 / PN500) TaxID=670386 RepID=D3B5U6_HETP5|nr:hypothetical protein PPL_04034 [Heterostelium album PN500]EFA83244.1 hypothetical protein PPL_04034 [Heterostelium album PN500]|eukprot:XP_020435361.1 hypothetical protein PPL_04034 [Heterostelium album PN500]
MDDIKSVNYTLPTNGNSFDFERFLKNAFQSVDDSIKLFKKHSEETDQSLDNLYEEFHICQQLYVRSSNFSKIENTTHFNNIHSLLNELEYISENVQERILNIQSFTKEIKLKLKSSCRDELLLELDHRVEINEKDLSPGLKIKQRHFQMVLEQTTMNYSKEIGNCRRHQIQKQQQQKQLKQHLKTHNRHPKQPYQHDLYITVLSQQLFDWILSYRIFYTQFFQRRTTSNRIC